MLHPRYFASFVVEVDSEPLPSSDSEVGIDLGLTSFAVLSNGTMIENPRFLRRAERKLRKAQQSLSRKNAAKNILAAGRADSPTPVELVSDLPRPSDRRRSRNPPEARHNRHRAESPASKTLLPNSVLFVSWMVQDHRIDVGCGG
ncbi:transposase [Nocardia vinacea]|uniref:transposase n=1 Tax=Nocardia vinacea TaxID=96468 RepID=UPI0003110284|nr:transposase [Nocardia vinacea]